MKDKKCNSIDHSKIKQNELRRVSTAIPEYQTDATTFLKQEKQENELKLDLDNSGFKSKTRRELYKELEASDGALNPDGEGEDLFELATLEKRGISLIIDIVFTAFVVKFALILVPFIMKGEQLFLDKYHLKLWVTDKTYFQAHVVINIVLALYFFVVVPVAFFNASFGKKILKLRVRGEGRYTITLSQAFFRELVFKPLGMACLVGFAVPFFDKKRRSLHDKMVGTFVVKD